MCVPRSFGLDGQSQAGLAVTEEPPLPMPCFDVAICTIIMTTLNYRFRSTNVVRIK